MNASEPPAGLTVRSAEEGDGAAFDAFACSDGSAHAHEVERFIRQRALRFALTAVGGYRLLVFHEEQRLVAVAGFHPELLLVAAGRAGFRGTDAVRLHVVAIASQSQGRRLADGRPLSRLVADTLIAHALGDEETMVLTAIVARANLRGIALCERHGLTSQIEHDARHVRLSGKLTRRPTGTASAR